MLSVLLALPRGRSAGEAMAGPEARVELVEDVVLRLVPELWDQASGATRSAQPYALDLRVTVENAGDEILPRWINISVLEHPGSEEQSSLSERWFGSLQTSHVLPGEAVSSDLGYRGAHGCGNSNCPDA